MLSQNLHFVFLTSPLLTIDWVSSQSEILKNLVDFIKGIFNKQWTQRLTRSSRQLDVRWILVEDMNQSEYFRILSAKFAQIYSMLDLSLIIIAATNQNSFVIASKCPAERCNLHPLGQYENVATKSALYQMETQFQCTEYEIFRSFSPVSP